MVGAEGGGREVEKRSQWVIRALVPRLELHAFNRGTLQ